MMIRRELRRQYRQVTSLSLRIRFQASEEANPRWKRFLMKVYRDLERLRRTLRQKWRPCVARPTRWWTSRPPRSVLSPRRVALYTRLFESPYRAGSGSGIAPVTSADPGPLLLGPGSVFPPARSGVDLFGPPPENDGRRLLHLDQSDLGLDHDVELPGLDPSGGTSGTSAGIPPPTLELDDPDCPEKRKKAKIDSAVRESKPFITRM